MPFPIPTNQQIEFYSNLIFELALIAFLCFVFFIPIICCAILPFAIFFAGIFVIISTILTFYSIFIGICVLMAIIILKFIVWIGAVYCVFNFFKSKKKKTQDPDSNSCPICFEQPIRLLKLKCEHKFCEECISSWYQKSNTCPMCREEFILPI